MTLAIIGIIVLVFLAAAFFGAPYVPSQRRYIDRAFTKLYKLGPNDVLVDIGAGDGIVLRAARRRGARAVGYEVNPFLWLIARFLSRGDKEVTIHLANFWGVRLPDDTTVVYAFSVHRDGPRLAKKMQREANRLGRPLELLCLGSPLKDRPVHKTIDAYYWYRFTPIQA